MLGRTHPSVITLLGQRVVLIETSLIGITLEQAITVFYSLLPGRLLKGISSEAIGLVGNESAKINRKVGKCAGPLAHRHPLCVNDS
jgi:hypothetical protein